jgi:hypothetical protein
MMANTPKKRRRTKAEMQAIRQALVEVVNGDTTGEGMTIGQIVAAMMARGVVKETDGTGQGGQKR